MNHILLWNCRGLGSAPAHNALKRIMILEHPHMVFLSETRLKAHEMELVKHKVKINTIAIDCTGDGRRCSGGLALLWKEEWDVVV